MMPTLERNWTSNNPMRIDINLGYYALCEAICTKNSCRVVLQRWCGLNEKSHRFKNWKPKTGEKTKMIEEVYAKHKDMRHWEIAELVGCTREMVTIVLRKIRVRKRNRWDGYISPDPRYSKEKRGAIKNG